MAEQQYTAEDIQNAVQAGVISPEDAQYLMESLEPETSGAAMGMGALGGLAGAGLGALAGGLGKKAGNALAGMENKYAKGAGNFLNKPLGNTPLGDEGTYGTAAGFVPGVLGGGAAGGYGGLAGGEAMFPGNPGSGVPASPPDENGNLDYDTLLNLLVDPSVPGDVKKQAMQMMQQMNQEGGSAGAGEADSFPLGAVGGGAAGAAAGGGVGMFGGNKLGAALGKGEMMPSMGKPMFGGKTNPTGLALGGLGMLAGGAGGALTGSMFDPNEKYRDPYGG